MTETQPPPPLAVGERQAIAEAALSELPKARWSCSDDESGTALTLARQRRWSFNAVRAAILSLDSPSLGEGTERRSALERMVACDEELEQEHPGWMTGQTPTTNAPVADRPWQCADCQCREYARLQDAGMGETDNVRCVSCKRVTCLPLTTNVATNADMRGAESIASIVAWCDETFGPAGAFRIARRANEEMEELLEKTPGDDWTDEARIEAADVLIVLLRTPGIWEAVEQKMAINRKRQWRLTGDGCGYHVPARTVLQGDQS